ncbi:isochorismate synthase [Pseudomonas sessilinigenes]|uniref:isochorismate synthase n=1 Tax=Pseudomonas sessilinigenes TaxID=658629 RepID=A0ABX8MJP9_9PSED|nr:isochorismate synthase [Pseudomonas sessilinigenes]AZC27123.1 Menaquinone-specific isochorismate synthase [Pseudomonas sessilinigenes]QXH38933.1 isochorismate synthase [Pseudomonas sessilinigenes]
MNEACLPGLTRALQDAEAQARREGRAVLVVFSQAAERLDPLRLFASNRQVFGQSLFWSGDQGALAMAGFGCTEEISPPAAERFAASTQAWRQLLERAHQVGPRKAYLCGGFSFDPEAVRGALWQSFADTSLVLPRILLLREGDQQHWLFSLWIEAEADVDQCAAAIAAEWNLLQARYAHGPRLQVPACSQPQDLDSGAQQWQATVAGAIERINAGALNKVVLAREVCLQAERNIPCGALLENLKAAYPQAFLFAFSRGDSCFLGATPERLVRVARGTLNTVALAGTCARGVHEQQDAELGQRLLDSPKDRYEHALVVQTLREALQPFCAMLEIAPQPQLHRLAHVQHLLTPVLGRLRPQVELLQLVQVLHPTPAVGGLPRASALEYIREHEQLDRGWYAAPVGWLNAEGDGEFAVALRSALIRGNQAHLFAGCGIVAESDPQSEYRETCLKLRTIGEALRPTSSTPGMQAG